MLDLILYAGHSAKQVRISTNYFMKGEMPLNVQNW